MPAKPTTPTRSTAAKSVKSATQKAVAVVDNGENIPRESGLDYIDEYGINHGGGVLIDGVLWAPVNCGYHKTKYPYGKLYQWGRKHGQGYSAPFMVAASNVRPDPLAPEIVPAPATPAEALRHPNRFYESSDRSLFNWTTNDMKLWNLYTDDGTINKNTAYDPCPKGWRVAVDHDYQSLMKHYSPYVAYYDGGQMGRWFSGSNPYSTNVPRIFLPAAGTRDRNAKCRLRDVSGKYWTNRHGGGEGLIWCFELDEDNARGVGLTPHAYPNDANSVRCVKDIKGQKMR